MNSLNQNRVKTITVYTRQEITSFFKQVFVYLKKVQIKNQQSL